MQVAIAAKADLNTIQQTHTRLCVYVCVCVCVCVCIFVCGRTRTRVSLWVLFECLSHMIRTSVYIPTIFCLPVR